MDACGFCSIAMHCRLECSSQVGLRTTFHAVARRKWLIVFGTWNILEHFGTNDAFASLVFASLVFQAIEEVAAEMSSWFSQKAGPSPRKKVASQDRTRQNLINKHAMLHVVACVAHIKGTARLRNEFARYASQCFLGQARHCQV